MTKSPARLTNLQARIGEVVRKTEDEFLKAELQELGRRIGDAREGIGIFLQQSAEEYVYWIERTGEDAAKYHPQRRAQSTSRRSCVGCFSETAAAA